MSDEAAPAVAGRAADAVQAEKVEQLGSPRTDETTTEIMGLEKKLNLKPTPPSNQQPPEPPEPETKVVCPLNKRGWTHTCDALQSDPTGQFQEEMTLCASPGCQRVGRCTAAEIRSGVTHLKQKSGAIGRFAAGSALADRFGFLVVGGGTKTKTKNKKVDVEGGGGEDDRDTIETHHAPSSCGSRPSTTKNSTSGLKLAKTRTDLDSHLLQRVLSHAAALLLLLKQLPPPSSRSARIR
mmetsp:Transcript_22242/g.56138  ORF Transcript_22242/g.56138 Transcript_22242/m.56138 type:complete len:238 (+) Transcript_22242:120-833(+)